MKIITAFIFILLLSTVGSASAEVFKCVSVTGDVIYSNAPCKKGVDSKSRPIKIDKPPLNEIGYTKYTKGFVKGYAGNFKIKDAVAHVSHRDQKIDVNLWLYPFRLNTEEIKIVDQGGLVGRDKLKPARFNFSFPSKLSKKIPYQDVSFTGLFLDNGTFITPADAQWLKLAKSIKLEYYPDNGNLAFEIKGKIDNYSLLINTKTNIYKKDDVPKSGRWIKPHGDIVFRHSVLGKLNYQNSVPVNLQAKEPHFTVKDLITEKWVKFEELNYDTYTQIYSISGLAPSKYRLHVTLEDSPEFSRTAVKPGELYGTKEFEIIDEITPAHVDIDMIGLIHLTHPVNNNYHMEREERKTYKNPIEFKWKPLSEHAMYKCIIRKVNKNGNHTSLDKYMEVSTRATNISINLTPGLYHFVLNAYNGDARSGEMRIYGRRWTGFEYVFLVGI